MTSRHSCRARPGRRAGALVAGLSLLLSACYTQTAREHQAASPDTRPPGSWAGRRAALALTACACILASVLVSSTTVAASPVAVPTPTVTPATGGGGVPLQAIWPLPVVFATDAHGNVLGGVRTPAVDVPLARLSGQAAAGGNMFCFLFGTTTPFTPEQLAQLYPDRGQFLSRWMLATVSAWEKGFLTAADGRDLINAAFQTDIGR